MSGYSTRGLKIAPRNIPRIIPEHSKAPNTVPHAVEAIGIRETRLPHKTLQLPKVPPYSSTGGRRKTYKKRKTLKKRKTHHRRR